MKQGQHLTRAVCTAQNKIPTKSDTNIHTLTTNSQSAIAQMWVHYSFFFLISIIRIFSNIESCEENKKQMIHKTHMHNNQNILEETKQKKKHTR